RGPKCRHFSERLFSVASGLSPKAPTFHELLEAVARRWFVFDDEHALRDRFGLRGIRTGISRQCHFYIVGRLRPGCKLKFKRLQGIAQLECWRTPCSAEAQIWEEFMRGIVIFLFAAGIATSACDRGNTAVASSGSAADNPTAADAAAAPNGARTADRATAVREVTLPVGTPLPSVLRASVG